MTAVAIIDIGITHLKLLLINPEQQVIASFRADNVALTTPPYLHMDVEQIWSWLLNALEQAAQCADISAIIPCTHGSAAALIDADGLILPIMHYEAQPPQSIVDGYAAIMPTFDEVFAPVNPGGLTLARQFYWQQALYPDAFAKTQTIMPYPQYWAWRLSGATATEVTSLGAQTHLWAPQRHDYSSLANARGWSELFPPLKNAWDTLGLLKPELSRQIGIAADTPVLCGIHDSNANYLRYLVANGVAGGDDFSLVSSGTWIINFNHSFDSTQLNAAYDTCTNSDVYARPVACSRFMGGREYGLIAADVSLSPSITDLARIIANNTMALPSFSDSGGPFPNTGTQGQIIGPKPTDAANLAALATLYTALMTKASLAHISTDNDIIIDGTFAKNTLFCQVFAALHRQRRVWTAEQQDGTALGAALLARLPDHNGPIDLQLTQVEPLDLDTLDNYAQRWFERANNK